MKKTIINRKNTLEARLKHKLKGLVEEVLKEGNPAIDVLSNRLVKMCIDAVNKSVDVKNDEEMAQIFANVASKLQKKALDIKRQGL